MAYRSSSSNSGNSTTPSTAVPSGAAIDDIVFLFATVDDGGGDFATGDWPTGFTELGEQPLTGDGQTVAVGWKRLTAADTGSYTFGAVTGVARDWVCQAVCFSGRHTTTAPTISTVATNNSANASPVTVTANGLTAASGDDLLWISGPDLRQTGVTVNHTAPTNYTERQDATSAWSSLSCATRDNVGAGATGTVSGSFTISSGTAGWLAWLIAVPAAGGTPASTSGVPAQAGAMQAVAGAVTAAASLVGAVALAGAVFAPPGVASVGGTPVNTAGVPALAGAAFAPAGTVTAGASTVGVPARGGPVFAPEGVSVANTLIDAGGPALMGSLAARPGTVAAGASTVGLPALGSVFAPPGAASVGGGAPVNTAGVPALAGAAFAPPGAVVAGASVAGVPAIAAGLSARAGAPSAGASVDGVPARLGRIAGPSGAATAGAFTSGPASIVGPVLTMPGIASTGIPPGVVALASRTAHVNAEDRVAVVPHENRSATVNENGELRNGIHDKDPSAVLDYAIDWSDWLQVGETIASSTWTITPSGLVQNTESETTQVATVWLSGGTDGTQYTVTNHITTSSARTDERSLTITVRQR